MIEFSLFDKIKGIANFIYKSPLFLVLLVALILVILDITLISKKSKSTKIIYSIISLLVVSILLSSYFNELISLLDVIAKNIVNIIYFPTLLEYLIMLMISIGLILYSIFSKKMSKTVKTISLISFVSNSFIFFMILDELSNNTIDLTNIIDIYSNDTLMILFETSLGIFVFWLIILIISKVIKFFIKRSEPISFYEEPELPKTLEEVRKEQIVFEPKVEYVVLEQENLDNIFTLDDYRKIRDILKSIQKN